MSNIYFDKSGLKIVPKNPYSDEIIGKRKNEINADIFLKWFEFEIKIMEMLDDKPYQEYKIEGGGMAYLYAYGNTKQDRINHFRESSIKTYHELRSNPVQLSFPNQSL